MKRKIRLLVLLIVIGTSVNFSSTFAQSTNTGNNRASGEFLGWDNTGSVGALQIRNDFSGQPIEFYLEGVTGNSGVMEIKEVTQNSVQFKNVGIGHILYFNPQSLLHLYTDGDPVYVQIGNGYAGAGENDGFKIGMNTDNLYAELRQQENAPMLFFTNNAERMRIIGDGRVGINTTTPASDVRLTVNNNNLQTAIYTITNRTTTTSVNIGIFSDATNTGVYGYAGGSDGQNMGGQFIAYNVGGSATSNNYGVYGFAASSSSNNYAGFFSGHLAVTGTIYNPPSDSSLKENITDMNISDALSIIKALAPKSYEYRTADYPGMSLPAGKQHGLMAQDLEQILPKLVADLTAPEVKDTKGNVVAPKTQYKGISYIGLIPYLIGAMQQQQTIIDSLSGELDKRLSDLETTVNQCCGGVGYRYAGPDETEDTETGNINHLSIELSSLQSIVLDQNNPNPFKEQTTISYFIPEDANQAQMLFFDMSGRMIKSVEVQKGYGTVTVVAQNLGSGIYSYSLQIDGQIVETKKMVKTK